MEQGARHNRLTAIRKTTGEMWLFLCSCGKEKEISKYHVERGTTKSCGCLHLERCSVGANRTKHGFARNGSVHPLHNIWRGILKRCYTKSSHAYPRYGGRGIGVCDEWKKDFVAFKKWAESSGYEPDLSIDRIDNSNGYSPENCRFVGKKEQARNRRSSRKIQIDGVEKTVAEWAEVLGLQYHNAYYLLTKKTRSINFERRDAK